MRTRSMAGLAALPLAVALVWPALAAEEGEIVVVLSEEPDIVDPCEASRSNVGRIVKQNVTETLTEIDPDDGSITPRLATEWEQVDDLTWRFKLQEGVNFHDGEPFNAEAAKTAIERTLDERIDCEIRIKFFGGMEVTPVVVDEHTLDIKTAEPAPILPTMMGTMTITSPNTVMGERTRDPVGTGPYRFVSWDARHQRRARALRRLLGRGARGREGDLRVPRRIRGARGHGRGRRGGHRAQHRGPGRDRSGDGLQLPQLRDLELPDRRHQAAARRPARAQGA